MGVWEAAVDAISEHAAAPVVPSISPPEENSFPVLGFMSTKLDGTHTPTMKPELPVLVTAAPVATLAMALVATPLEVSSEGEPVHETSKKKIEPKLEPLKVAVIVVLPEVELSKYQTSDRELPSAAAEDAALVKAFVPSDTPLTVTAASQIIPATSSLPVPVAVTVTATVVAPAVPLAMC